MNDDTNTATPTKKSVNDIVTEIKRRQFEKPYAVVTEAPPLPPEVAALYTADGKYPDDNTVAALDLETLAKRYHQARRYQKEAADTFEQEIRWLEKALSEVKSAQSNAGVPLNVLGWEWERRRTPEPITWQGVRKVLKDAGMTLDDKTTSYTRKIQRERGEHLFTARKVYGGDTEVYVSVDHTAALDRAQQALEATGYTIKRRNQPGPGDLFDHGLYVVKLRDGQTLDDINQPYMPPQTTEPA